MEEAQGDDMAIGYRESLTPPPAMEGGRGTCGVYTVYAGGPSGGDEVLLRAWKGRCVSARKTLRGGGVMVGGDERRRALTRHGERR